MNFLAHLLLAGEDEGLRLGAMLGDFTRGQLDNTDIPRFVRRGIELHRFIDQTMDALPEVARLREHFDPPFRRYSGIIIDVAFDHELAKRWDQYATIPLRQFDLDVRAMLARNEFVLPEKLQAFMRYADRRGLFAAYREETEILFSLQGIGRRLSRANPLHRVAEVWPDVKPMIGQTFHSVFSQVQQAALLWRLEKSEPNRARPLLAGSSPP